MSQWTNNLHSDPHQYKYHNLILIQNLLHIFFKYFFSYKNVFPNYVQLKNKKIINTTFVMVPIDSLIQFSCFFFHWFLYIICNSNSHKIFIKIPIWVNWVCRPEMAKHNFKHALQQNTKQDRKKLSVSYFCLHRFLNK